MTASPASSTYLTGNLATSRRVTSVETRTTVTVEGSSASPVSIGLKCWTRCRYSDRKYTYPASTAPISSIAATAARRAGTAKICSGSMGEAAVRSVTTKPTASATASTSATRVTGAVNPCCWPSLSPKISAAIAIVTSNAPRTSRWLPPEGRLAGSRPMSASMMAISGGLTRNTARQPRYSVRNPPAMIPAVAPAAVVACQMDSARLRAGPSGFIVVSSDNAAGETIAPPAPWITRPMISMIAQRANPQASDATANTISPAASSRRRPIRSASRPPASSSEPNVNA